MAPESKPAKPSVVDELLAEARNIPDDPALGAAAIYVWGRDVEAPAIGVPLPLPSFPGWHAVATFVVTDRGPRLGRVAIAPTSDPTAPRSGEMRRLRRELEQLISQERSSNVTRRMFGEILLDEARRALEKWGPIMNDDPAAGPALRSIFDRKATPSRRPTTETQLTVLAARYVELSRENPHNPRQQLAAETGLTGDQIRDRLQRAKRAGVYEPAGHGLAGGQLTAKGREILRAAAPPPGRRRPTKKGVTP